MFNEILKSLRARDGLSQVRFAEEIGFSQAAVSAWENNTREPGILALINIAKYFNVSVDYLVGNSSLNLEKREQSSSEEQSLIKHFRCLPPDLQRRALTYMQNLGKISQEEKILQKYNGGNVNGT